MTEWREQPVCFTCQADQLVGIVHHARGGDGRLGVLVAVGGPQYRVGSHRQFTQMARWLADAGVAVMRFDYRGMGDSDGEVRTFEAISDDIGAAVDAFARTVPSLESVVLWGLCDAASAALMSEWRDTRIAGVVLANPWVRTQAGEARAYLSHYYGQRLLQRSFWEKVLTGKFGLLKSGRDFLLAHRVARRRRLAGDVSEPPSFIDRMRVGLQSFQGPMLILISDQDLTAREFQTLCDSDPRWQAAVSRPNVRTVLLSGADHTFSRRASLEAVCELCREWLAGLEIAQPSVRLHDRASSGCGRPQVRG